MNKDSASRVLSYLDERYVDEASAFADEKRGPELPHTAVGRSRTGRVHLTRWGTMAACMVLIAAIAATALAGVAEAKEYNVALKFFEENGLPVDGLSRSELKAVYRDITEHRFTYGKTAEVIRQTVPGWAIPQEDPKPEDLAAVWDWRNPISPRGISFRIDSAYVPDEASGLSVLKSSRLECYRDGEQIWVAEFEDVYIEDYATHSDGETVVWGQNDPFQQTRFAWVAQVDQEGAVRWQCRLDHGFPFEHVVAAFRNGDGSWDIISRGGLTYLCYSSFDADGNERFLRKTEIGNFGIRNAARLGDGYLIQLWNGASGDTAILLKMDGDGVLTDNFTYGSDDCDYYITDMIEFEGQVFLSAYAVPKQHDAGGRHEIADLLAYTFQKGLGGNEVTSEELTPLVRDNYTAMLLMCDPESGQPRTFYSVEGSLGGKLSVNDAGQLEWNVESIVSTFFSPFTSSFTIGGTCKVFMYTFDAFGNLTGSSDTGDTVRYAR